MCGRFVSRADAAAEREWGLVTPWHRAFGSHNVSPTQDVPVIVSTDGDRAGVFMRWGLIPAFAHGQAGKYNTINARIETVEKSPAYRGPWRRGQRCVVPVVGFYEWQGRQPHFIYRADGHQMGLAGLWDRSASVESFTIITMPANELVGRIHAKQRMPAILQDDAVSAWLAGEPDVLATYPADRMAAHPVSTRVNTPRNDDAALIEPV